MKNLKFVNLEENKYFYRVLKEEDGTYKGIVGIGQEDGFMKEGNKQYKDGRFLKENEKKIKEKEKNFQMVMFMKASLKLKKKKEKEFINEPLERFMKEIEKVIKEKEKEF